MLTHHVSLARAVVGTRAPRTTACLPMYIYHYEAQPHHLANLTSTYVARGCQKHIFCVSSVSKHHDGGAPSRSRVVPTERSHQCCGCFFAHLFALSYIVAEDARLELRHGFSIFELVVVHGVGKEGRVSRRFQLIVETSHGHSSAKPLGISTAAAAAAEVACIPSLFLHEEGP